MKMQNGTEGDSDKAWGEIVGGVDTVGGVDLNRSPRASAPLQRTRWFRTNEKI